MTDEQIAQNVLNGRWDLMYAGESAERLARAYLALRAEVERLTRENHHTLSEHHPISDNGTFVNNGSIAISDGNLTTGITTYDPRKGAE